MANSNRSRKQVRESRALGLALTPKAVRYFEKRPTDRANTAVLAVARNPTTQFV